MQTDRELLDGWRAGDQRAGEQLFDRYFSPLVRFFRNKVGRGVDDLVQQTLLGCLESKDRVPDDVAVRSYVFGIARNVLFNHFRRERRVGAAVDPELHSAADLGPGPRTILLAKAEDRALLEALRQIPLRDQIVLELYFWEQLAASEIGAALGAPEPTVRTWIRRAKQTLQSKVAALVSSGGIETTHTNLDDWAEAVKRALEGG